VNHSSSSARVVDDRVGRGDAVAVDAVAVDAVAVGAADQARRDRLEELGAVLGQLRREVVEDADRQDG
jgi:hypothetical protein